jgi:hypothetical protein
MTVVVVDPQMPGARREVARHADITSGRLSARSRRRDGRLTGGRGDDTSSDHWTRPGRRFDAKPFSALQVTLVEVNSSMFD